MSEESLLKKKRLEKKLSIYDVEKILKIRAKHLEALEERKYADTPGITYAIGYFRAYSSLLDFNEEEKEKIIEEINKSFGKEEKKPTIVAKEVIKLGEEDKAKKGSEKKIKTKNMTKGIAFSIIITIIGVLAFLGFKLFTQEGEFSFSKKGAYTPYIKVTIKENSPNSSAKNLTSLTPKEVGSLTPEGTPLATPSPTPLPKVVAKFNILVKPKGEGWAKVFTEEKVLFDSIMAKGREYIFKSDKPITLIFENSDFFSVYIKNKMISIPKGKFIKYIINKETGPLNNG